MPYVKRNEDGDIVAISQTPDEGFSEELQRDDPAIRKFAKSLSWDPATMMVADLDFIRVMEDLIDVLVEKNHLLFTDLPEKAQEKISNRRELRGKITRHLDLFSDDEGFF